MGNFLLATLEMETPSSPKSSTSNKPVYVGNVETTGDTWTDVREATKVWDHSTSTPSYLMSGVV